jgi:predicted metalloprotease
MKEQGLHEALDRELRKLSPLVKSGQVVFKQIGDIAELWKKDYAEEGNLYDAVTFTAFREWKSLNCGE